MNFSRNKTKKIAKLIRESETAIITDEQIIKALECCTTTCAGECPMNGTRNCMTETMKHALELIKWQEAEIRNLYLNVENEDYAYL